MGKMIDDETRAAAVEEHLRSGRTQAESRDLFFTRTGVTVGERTFREWIHRFGPSGDRHATRVSPSELVRVLTEVRDLLAEMSERGCRCSPASDPEPLPIKTTTPTTPHTGSQNALGPAATGSSPKETTTTSRTAFWD